MVDEKKTAVNKQINKYRILDFSTDKVFTFALT